MPFYDFHIHTRHSSCCKEAYGYPEVFQKISELGFDGFGVADHSNYTGFNASFIDEHRKYQKSLHAEQKGLVGLEISITNQNGDLGVHPKFLQQLDYFIIAEHVHIAKPLSGYFTFKARMLKWMADYPNSEAKINRGLEKLLDLELNAIRRYPHSILAHIFRFPVNNHFVTPKIFEMTERILEALQANEVALELHSNFLHGYFLDDAAASKHHWHTDASIRDFYRNLAHRIHKYTLKFALGSDAHKLTSLHPKSEWEKLLTAINVQENQLVTPVFFQKAK
jgi:histidinol phosphatase-like PHP family hydrolase